MAVEIEHKFLLISDEWRNLVSRSEVVRQGYLSNNPAASVRIRIANDQASLNIKGMTIGIHRPEYEYSIPWQDAVEMLNQLCARPLIEKTRHFLEFAGKTWEIDEFTGENLGLIVAELELTAISEYFQKPTWVGKEVSGIERYYNVSLLTYPYSQWTEAEKTEHVDAA